MISRTLALASETAFGFTGLGSVYRGDLVKGGVRGLLAIVFMTLWSLRLEDEQQTFRLIISAILIAWSLYELMHFALDLVLVAPRPGNRDALVARWMAYGVLAVVPIIVADWLGFK